MTRPKTQSPTIGFRIPIELWSELERRAAAHDESPGEYVRRQIIRALERPPSGLEVDTKRPATRPIGREHHPPILKDKHRRGSP